MGAIPYLLVSIQTATVLVMFGRGFWRSHPAWTTFGLLAVVQSCISLLYSTDQWAAWWCIFAILLMLSEVDMVLEHFLRLSRLYKRFRRDRWTWLALPVLPALILPTVFLYEQLTGVSEPSLYRRLFLAQVYASGLGVLVLTLGWIATIPVGMPKSDRMHHWLLTIYLAVVASTYSVYLRADDQQLIQRILTYMPMMTWLLWLFVVVKRPIEVEAVEAETLPGDTSLDQILKSLRKLP